MGKPSDAFLSAARLSLFFPFSKVRELEQPISFLFLQRSAYGSTPTAEMNGVKTDLKTGTS